MRAQRRGYDPIPNDVSSVSDVSDSEAGLNLSVDFDGQPELPFHQRVWNRVNGPEALEDAEATRSALTTILAGCLVEVKSFANNSFAPTIKLALLVAGFAMTLFGAIGFFVAGGPVNKLINVSGVSGVQGGRGEPQRADHQSRFRGERVGGGGSPATVT